MAHVRGKGRYRAAITGIVAVGGRKIVAQDGLACRLRVFTALDLVLPTLVRMLKGLMAGFVGQGFLGREMPVETTVGQPGGGHYVRQADAVQARSEERRVGK